MPGIYLSGTEYSSSALLVQTAECAASLFAYELHGTLLYLVLLMYHIVPFVCFVAESRQGTTRAPINRVQGRPRHKVVSPVVVGCVVFVFASLPNGMQHRSLSDCYIIYR